MGVGLAIRGGWKNSKKAQNLHVCYSLPPPCPPMLGQLLEGVCYGWNMLSDFDNPVQNKFFTDTQISICLAANENWYTFASCVSSRTWHNICLFSIVLVKGNGPFPCPLAQGSNGNTAPRASSHYNCDQGEPETIPKTKKNLFLQDTNATVYKIINVIEAKLEIVNILESSVSLSLCAAYCDRTTGCEGFR